MVQKSLGPLLTTLHTLLLEGELLGVPAGGTRRQCAHPPVRQVSQVCLSARESGTLEGLVAQQFHCVVCPFVNACTNAQEMFLRI